MCEILRIFEEKSDKLQLRWLLLLAMTNNIPSLTFAFANPYPIGYQKVDVGGSG